MLLPDQQASLEKLLKRNPNPLEEDDVKRLLQSDLESRGRRVKVKYGRERGSDVDAQNGSAHWIIEAKGWGRGVEQQQGNYFLCALAELLQRMRLDEAKYSIAFPDLPRYRGLWERLPDAAKRRTGISCLFVSKDGSVVELQ
jgi:hypothetical protein